MNIGIDSLAFFRDKNRGIGIGVISQIINIAKNDKNNDYYFLNITNENIFNFALNLPNFHEIKHYVGSFETLKNNNSLYGTIVSKFIEAYKINVFYIPSAFNGVINKYEKSWFVNSKVIIMLHDAIPCLFPKIYFQNKDEKRRYFDIINSIKNFDAFFANSMTTKNDFVNVLNFDSSKIFVVYSSPNQFFKKHIVDASTKNSILKKYNINGNYIISVSGDDVRKNNEALIKSYALLPETIKKQLQLVIVCSLSKETLDKLTSLIKSNKLFGRVVLTNYVDDSTLDVLYNHATAFAFPSLYEGFGLPLIEAYNYNLPTLTSNSSSLKEIGEKASILVDPTSVDSIRLGLLKLLDKSNWPKMIEAGNKVAAFYNWDDISKKMIDIFSNMFPSKDVSNLKRFAVFCPLPPIKSGISDFSVGLINELSEHNFVDVFIDGYQPKVCFNSHVRILNVSSFNYSMYDRVVYEMGCSEYHSYMIPFILKYKGIIEMHDCYYSALLDYIRKNTNSLFNVILENFGKILTSKKEKLTPIELKEKYWSEDYLFKILINSGDSFIVHNNYAKEKILKERIAKIITIPLAAYYKLEKFNKGEARKKLKLSESEWIFSSLGFVTISKRPLELLKAFSMFLNTNHLANAKLFFIGSIDKSAESVFYSEVKKLRLPDNKVCITNFVDRNTYNLFLSSIDLNFNLRSIYNGESSAVLSDLSYLGIPNIIEKIGVFDEIPDNCAKKIDHSSIDSIIQNIYFIMNDFYHNRDKYIDFFKKNETILKSTFDFKYLKSAYIYFLLNNRDIYFNFNTLNNLAKNEKGNRARIAKSLAWCLKFSL